MKKQLITALTAGVFSFAVMQTVPVYAMHDQDKHCSKKHECIMAKIDEMKVALGLTAEQDAKLKAIRDNNHTFMKAKHQEMHMLHEEGNKLATEKDIDKKKLDMLADKAGKISREIFKQRVMTRHDVIEVLDMKQRMMLKEKMDKARP